MISFICLLTACGKIESNKRIEVEYNTSIVFTIQENDSTAEQIKDLITKLSKRAELYISEYEVLVNTNNEIIINMQTTNFSGEFIDELVKPIAIEFIDEKAYENKMQGKDYEVLLDCSDIDNAQVSVIGNDNGVEYCVHLKLTEKSSREFEDITRDNIGKIIYVMYNDEIIMSPYVTSAISGGDVVVTGIDSIENAEMIASYINIGQLPLTLEFKELIRK